MPDCSAFDISSTYGVFFWGFSVSFMFVHFSLLGVSLVQGYYYHKTNTDTLFMRAFVFVLLIIDLTGSALIAQSLHYYLIRNFGNASALLKITKTFIGEYILTVIIILLSQLFYASRIYAAGAHSKGHPVALVIAILSVLSFGAGIAGCYELFMKDRLMANLALPTVKIIFGIVKLSVALCDGLATFSMCYYLSSYQTSFKTTKSVLSWLFFFSIHRGFLVCAAQIAHMVAYLAWPQKTYWIPFHLAMSKLHVLTLLAMLNSRSTLRARFRSRAKLFERDEPNLTTYITSQMKIRSDSSPENEADVKAVDREPPLTPDSMELNKIRTNHSSTVSNDLSHAKGVEIIDIVKGPFTA